MSRPKTPPTGNEMLTGPIGVVGGGALGGWMASLMKNRGWDVSLLLRPGREEIPTELEYRVCGAGDEEALDDFGVDAPGRQSIPCAATDAAGEPFRWLFFAVKATDLPEVAHQVAARINSGTRLVFPGNGLDLPAPFRALDSDRFLIASTTYGLFKVGRTSVSVRGDDGEFSVGSIDSFAGDAEDTRCLSSALGSLGLRAHQVSDGAAAMWQKAILSAGLNPVCALLGLENGELPASSGFALATEASNEAQRVAAAEGVDLAPTKVAEALKSLCEKTAANRCSMLQDLDSGAMTEVAWINGVVVKLGKKNNIPTPANRLLLDLVEGASTETPVQMSLN